VLGDESHRDHPAALSAYGDPFSQEWGLTHPDDPDLAISAADLHLDVACHIPCIACHLALLFLEPQLPLALGVKRAAIFSLRDLIITLSLVTYTIPAGESSDTPDPAEFFLNVRLISRSGTAP
jgi:hypothetical protein